MAPMASSLAALRPRAPVPCLRTPTTRYGPDYYSGSFHPDYTFGYRYGYDDSRAPIVTWPVFASPYSYYDAYAGRCTCTATTRRPMPARGALPAIPTLRPGPRCPYAAPHLIPTPQPLRCPLRGRHLRWGPGSSTSPKALSSAPSSRPRTRVGASTHSVTPQPIRPPDGLQKEFEEPEEAAANSRPPPFASPSAAFFEQQGMDKPARSKLSPHP